MIGNQYELYTSALPLKKKQLALNATGFGGFSGLQAVAASPVGLLSRALSMRGLTISGYLIGVLIIRGSYYLVVSIRCPFLS